MVSASMMSSSSLVAAAAGMRGAGTLGTKSLATAPHSPRLPRRRAPAVVVRAQSNKKPDDADPLSEPITTAPPEEKNQAFWDAMSFSGPGPERINGRLAMVGFVAALAVEASRGVGLLSQAGDGAGVAWFAYATVVLSAASLAPLLQGESVEERSGGIWTADAELWNGRAAMLGLVALAATEYLTGSPLISA